MTRLDLAAAATASLGLTQPRPKRQAEQVIAVGTAREWTQKPKRQIAPLTAPAKMRRSTEFAVHRLAHDVNDVNGQSRMTRNDRYPRMITPAVQSRSVFVTDSLNCGDSSETVNVQPSRAIQSEGPSKRFRSKSPRQNQLWKRLAYPIRPV